MEGDKQAMQLSLGKAFQMQATASGNPCGRSSLGLSCVGKSRL